MKTNTRTCTLCADTTNTMAFYDTMGQAYCTACYGARPAEVAAMHNAWNAHHREVRAARKVQESAAANESLSVALEALAAAGLRIGARVTYFAASMLGLGGMVVEGTVCVYRGRLMVKCRGKVDTTAGCRRYVTWNRGWKAA